MKKMGRKNALHFAVLGLALIFMLFPLVTMLLTAFKSTDEVMVNPAGFWPHEWNLENFVKVFAEFDFLRYLGNSLFITVLTCVGTTATSALTAYAYARFRVKYKNLIFTLMLATIFVPGQMLQIPLYELYRSINWMNTFFPLIVPAFLGGGIVNVFLIRQFFKSIPQSFFESATVDGAGEFKIFLKIAVPLATPIILTVAVFTFVGAWNDFFSPLIYLTDPKLYTLAYGLFISFSKFSVAGQTAWNLVCASNLVVILPIIILYFICQKYFVSGLAAGGIKG